MIDALRRRGEQLGLVFSKKARRGFVLATFGSVVVALLEAGSILLVAPLLQLLMGGDLGSGALGSVAEAAGITSTNTMILWLLGLVVLGFVTKDVFTLFFRWWVTGFINQERAGTYVALLRYYLNAPYSLFLNRSTAQLLRVIGDSTGEVYAKVAQGLMSVVIELTTVAVIGVALIFATPTYSLGLIVFFAVSASILLRRVRVIASREGLRQLQLAEAGYDTALHALGGAKEIKIRHTQHHFTERYWRIESASANTQRLLAFLAELPKHALEIAFFLAFFALTTAVVLTQGTGNLMVSIGLLGAGAFRLLPALSRLVAAITNIRAGLPALDDIASDLRAERNLASPQPPAETPMPYDTAIVISDVYFRYQEDLPDVLSSINLRIDHGSSIAFVGSSGAGKSTLIDTILGLHAPTKGVITVDGIDISTDLAAWHANIAVVPQDVYLFNSTIRENVAFDQEPEDIDDELVHASLERAQLTEVIDGLPEGIYSRVGERGTRLSGGQRQRLGIARALYRKPRLLVLDEATSALDNETERRITETIASLHGEVTVIVVAHRLSTVRDMDTVAFMSSGKIVSIGDFDSVRAENEEFANLVRLGSLNRDNTA